MPEQIPVLVVGAGLAGATAAIAAAEAGARVMVACAGRLFGGSSFRESTWGLGLVAPESEQDVDDLCQTVLSVGGGAADAPLVRSFVSGIAGAMEWLQDEGIVLKRPDNPQEREFVPCFDHKHRLWRGLEREPLTAAFAKRFDDLGIRTHEHCELLDIRRLDASQSAETAGDDGKCSVGNSSVPNDGPGSNALLEALFLDRAIGRMETARAASIVLATGGCGGLFERRLGAAEDTGAGHACALRLGATLTNMEFFQIMPGLVGKGEGAVFNEKVFRWTELTDEEGADAVAPFAQALGASSQEALDARSGHGPFTSRLVSQAVDLAMDAAGPQGLRTRFVPAPDKPLPEFARTYFQWLQDARGISPDEEVRIAPFAHASNGGIAIDSQGWTGVEGLYACGECTGGMHGADRLGGLSSANCLVFGLRAGQEAAKHAKGAQLAGCAADNANGSPSDGARPHDDPQPAATAQPAGTARSTGAAQAIASTQGAETARRALARIRRIMTESCLINRTETDLRNARRELAVLKAAAEADPSIGSLETVNAATTALAMVDAALARTESLGSHHRADARSGLQSR